MAEMEFAPLSDVDRDICQRAVTHFEERKFVESANLFSQIQYRPEDFRIKHNWKVAEFYARNTTDYVEFFKELGSIIKEGEIKVDNLVPEAIKYPVILFNLAVLYYHNKHFRKALDILIQLSRNLSNIINQFAKRVKLLYIDILIKIQQFDKAMEEIDHFESQLKAHGDMSLSTNPSMSTTSSIQSLPRDSPKPACFSPGVAVEDNKDITDSNFDASVRIKLQQYRTYSCLCTHSLRSAKREIKQLFAMTNSNNQNVVGLYLKAYSDYLRGNLKKAVKVIMSFPVENYQKTFSESGDFIEMMVMNNVACCNFYMGKPTIAAFHFQEAGRKFSMEGLEDKKTLPLHAISYSKKYEIVYNFGVSVLHAGKPHEAFKYLNLCLGAYYMNCRLWLRIAECCIQIHKPTNENDLKWTQEKRNLVRGVIGTETNKKVLITNPSPPYSTKNRTAASSDLPEPTLEYANNCIENALKLIQSDTVTNEGCLYVKPSNPMTNLQEISCLHAAILCAGAYIALELEDFTLATKRSLDLLGIPSLPGAYQYLGKMYLTQSLFKFGDVSRSLQIYSNECSTFDLRYCVSPLDADDKKDDNIMSSESGWSNASGQVKMLQIWYPNDEVTAQAAFVYNHAVALAASGDTGKAAEVLKAWITKSPTVLPPEFLMLAVYIHVKLGNLSKAKSLLKQHSPNYNLQ